LCIEQPHQHIGIEHGHKDAGENLAALYTVVATCVANEVDPLAYLTDVLTRLDSTPADQVDTVYRRTGQF